MASKRGSGWQAHPASCARKPLRREPLLPSSPASTQMRASSFQRRRAGIQFSVHRLVHSLRVGSWISASKQDLRLAKILGSAQDHRSAPSLVAATPSDQTVFRLRRIFVQLSRLSAHSSFSLQTFQLAQALGAMSESHNLPAPFCLRNPPLRKFHAPSASSDLHRAIMRVLKRAVLLVGSVDRSALVVLGCFAVITSPSAAFVGPQGRAAVPLIEILRLPVPPWPGL